MKTYALITLIISFIAIVCFPDATNGQQRSRVQVRINDIEIERRRNPSFSTRGYSEARSQRRYWGIIAAEYEVQGGERGWIDNLSFNWHLMMRNGDVPRVIMNRTITYQDIYEDDGDHYAVVFLRPNVIRRYYDDRGKISKRDITIHLEVTRDGRTLVQKDYNKPKGIPERWWTFSPPKVNVVDHGLLARPETPFAHLAYDFYEFIKPE